MRLPFFGILEYSQTQSRLAGFQRMREVDLPLPYARRPFPGVLSGGVPSRAELEAAKAAGFCRLVDLRTPAEIGAEPALAQELGLDYVLIPIGGAQDLTILNARRLAEAVRDAAQEPVIVFCRSGNRVGALFAVKAGLLDGAAPEAALALGESAGLADPGTAAAIRAMLAAD